MLIRAILAAIIVLTAAVRPVADWPRFRFTVEPTFCGVADERVLREC
jgi:hypothetical protein